MREMMWAGTLHLKAQKSSKKAAKAAASNDAKVENVKTSKSVAQLR